MTHTPRNLRSNRWSVSGLTKVGRCLISIWLTWRRLGTGESVGRQIRAGGVWCVWLLLWFSMANAQERLRSFEKSFSDESSSPKTDSASSSSSRSTVSEPGLGDQLIEELAEGVVLGLVAGGRQAEIQAKLRGPGHPLLPVAKVQAGWQSITSDLQATDYQLLLGHGLLGAEFRHTHFRERDADSHLNLLQAHLLYRMAVTPRLQWNLGVGGAWLNGKETRSGISFATPLRWWPLDWLGVELQPAWTWFNSVRLTDVDAGVVLRYRRVNVHAGYRWLESGNDAASLSGFRMGVGGRF